MMQRSAERAGSLMDIGNAPNANRTPGCFPILNVIQPPGRSMRVAELDYDSWCWGEKFLAVIIGLIFCHNLAEAADPLRGAMVRKALLSGNVVDQNIPNNTYKGYASRSPLSLDFSLTRDSREGRSTAAPIGPNSDTRDLKVRLHLAGKERSSRWRSGLPFQKDHHFRICSIKDSDVVRSGPLVTSISSCSLIPRSLDRMLGAE
jgi:hypothetical protein